MSDSPCHRIVAALACGAALLGLTAAPAHAATTPATTSPTMATAPVGNPWWLPSWRVQDALACRVTDSPGAWGLQAWPAAVRARVAAQFGLSSIGGYRPGTGSSDHHTGNAIDVMVRGDRGDEIARWFQDNAGTLNVKYVIWEQGYWHPGMSGWRRMADRGSETANHYDHVHVSFRSGWGSCPG